MCRSKALQMTIVGCVLFSAFLACEPVPPEYVQQEREWRPLDLMWFEAPMPDRHRLQDYTVALSNRPVRIPEARRRAQIPERRALSNAAQKVKPKEPPGKVKVLVLRGKTEIEASIWVDGIKVGRVPMFLHLASGSHRFEVKTVTGETQVRQVQIRPRSNPHLVFRFAETAP